MTICDIYEHCLLGRPYKRAIPTERALDILKLLWFATRRSIRAIPRFSGRQVYAWLASLRLPPELRYLVGSVVSAGTTQKAELAKLVRGRTSC